MLVSSMLIKEAITEIAQQLKSNEHIDYSNNGLLDNLSSDLTEDDISWLLMPSELFVMLS